MRSTANILHSLNLPTRDAYELPTSHKRFSDGGQYRVEIPSCEVEEWASGVARRRGFTTTGHQADIFGLCTTCQRAARKPARVS